jgi:Kef-type K+ transport system membrane component KefB
MFLPSFFALTGLRTQLALVGGGDALLACALIMAVTPLGKFGGSTLAATATGMRWRPAMALGILMNARGLMELTVLNVGLELEVISLQSDVLVRTVSNGRGRQGTCRRCRSSPATSASPSCAASAMRSRGRVAVMYAWFVSVAHR